MSHHQHSGSGATIPATAKGELTHLAFFYRDTSEYVAALAGFIREGLKENEPVAAALPGRHHTAVRKELGAARTRVRWVDLSTEGRDSGCVLPGILLAFAEEHPGEHVRIVAEPVWSSLDELAYEACVQCEALINTSFAWKTATVVCAYHEAALGVTALRDAAATHSLLVDRHGTRPSHRFAPMVALRRYDRPFPAPPKDAAALEFDAARLARARRFVADHACRLGIGGHRLDDVVLATHELSTNSVVHGGGTGTLRVWAGDGWLTCEVRDKGRFSGPLAGCLPVGLEQRGGRGLHLAHQLSDSLRMDTTSTGTTVRISFRVRPTAEARNPGSCGSPNW